MNNTPVFLPCKIAIKVSYMMLPIPLIGWLVVHEFWPSISQLVFGLLVILWLCLHIYCWIEFQSSSLSFDFNQSRIMQTGPKAFSLHANEIERVVFSADPELESVPYGNAEIHAAGRKFEIGYLFFGSTAQAQDIFLSLSRMCPSKVVHQEKD